ncbi:hypothetical protein CEXT_377391 [Caerostris extrusa]|uniref:Uncharacterized protein n=1 Tax=Caerostris extrusa TaxID=172846 RepID=A0AAV4QH15_CAEEX|nr:hypothetical protein CEXT_377391 [Caerostris extrusa]
MVDIKVFPRNFFHPNLCSATVLKLVILKSLKSASTQSPSQLGPTASPSSSSKRISLEYHWTHQGSLLRTTDIESTKNRQATIAYKP